MSEPLREPLAEPIRTLEEYLDGWHGAKPPKDYTFENPCCEVPLSGYEPCVLPPPTNPEPVAREVPIVSIYFMLVCFISVIATGFCPPMFIIAVVAAVLAAYINREESDEDDIRSSACCDHLDKWLQ